MAIIDITGFNWKIEIPSDKFLEYEDDTPFFGSDYDVLVNNVMDNRENNRLFNLDHFFTYFAKNTISAINRTTSKAQVPESYYSSLRHILPRYLGCKLQSIGYNEPAIPSILNQTVEQQEAQQQQYSTE